MARQAALSLLAFAAISVGRAAAAEQCATASVPSNALLQKRSSRTRVPLPAEGLPEVLLGMPQDSIESSGPLSLLDPEAFVGQLEPCVPRLMAGKEPEMLQTGVPSLGAILVVHATWLTERGQKMRELFSRHNLTNWSFIEGFDGNAIDVEAQKCFFGPWLSRIDGEGCCNRESSTLKPHLALLAMVTKRVHSALILEDDTLVTPSSEALRTRLARAAAMLDAGCDMVRLSPFSVGYMMSNAGARKMLHYSLKRGGKRLSNPMDWQQDEVSRAKYNGFRDCHGEQIFDHYGHTTNHGGKSPMFNATA